MLFKLQSGFQLEQVSHVIVTCRGGRSALGLGKNMAESEILPQLQITERSLQQPPTCGTSAAALVKTV